MTVATTSAMQTAFPGLLGFGIPGGAEWIILLILGLLVFGRRLPEVGRNLGRSIVEFKKGIKGIQEEIETESSSDKKFDAAPTHELPRTSEPAEPRVSHDPVSSMGSAAEEAAGLDDSEPEKVKHTATGGSDPDRASG